MARVGDYEIVTEQVTVNGSTDTNVSFSVDVPEGKVVLFGWESTHNVQVVRSNPNNDGTSWLFELHSFVGTVNAELRVSCAAL